MITVFNRKQLIMTYDMNVQSRVRDILAANNVDYIVNPIMFSARMYTPAEYKIYVRKKDYEFASFLLKTYLKDK